MKKLVLIVAMLMVLGIVTMAKATLIVRGTDTQGYRLIYDDDLNITWYDFINSSNTWQGQKDWADALAVTFNGTTYNDWRLPSTGDAPDMRSWGYNGTTSFGYNITSSELGHLFYDELGNKGYYATDGANPQTGFGTINFGAFQNLRPNSYWSGTEYPDEILGWGFNSPDALGGEVLGDVHDRKWNFNFYWGAQSVNFDWLGLSAVAVRDGDVGNSAPHALPSGEGTYQVKTSVVIGGQVSDFDGDPLSYEWLEGATVLSSGTIQAVIGGTPVYIPDVTINNLAVGTHTLTLKVSDGINQPVSANITVEIIDTIAPILAPAPDKTILWPANHKMVTVTIYANASDNSGGPVTLSASVASNEPQEGLGDGDTPQDWTTPVINNGIITLQLRAERSGKGSGRIYTVTIVATDGAGNSSTAKVNISVPHDKGK